METAKGWGKNRYKVYLFLASRAAPQIWRYETRARLAPALTPLMLSPRGKTSLRVDVLQPNPHDQYCSAGKFGTVFWNDKGHQKWTLDSPLTGREPQKWKFQSVQAWSPGPGYCKGASPDAMFAVANPEAGLGDKAAGFFYQYITLLALADDAHFDQKHVDGALSALRECTNPVLAAWTTRSWDQSKPLHLTDAGVYYLYGLERHAGEPSVDTLKGGPWNNLI